MVVTLLTRPTEQQVLLHFYNTVQPAGFWGPIAKQVNRPEIPRQFRKDLVNVIIGIPCLIGLWMSPIFLVLHRYDESLFAAAVSAFTAMLLYKTWYQQLPSAEE